MQFSSKCVLLVVSVLQASDEQLQMTPHASLCAVWPSEDDFYLQHKYTDFSVKGVGHLKKIICRQISPLQKLL